MILKDNNRIFAYIREYKNQLLLVINNFYGESVNISLDKDLIKNKDKAKTLISNYNEENILKEHMTIKPYESIVYLIES